MAEVTTNELATVDNEELKVIVFQLKDEEYGIDVQQVLAIERLEHITRVPGTINFVKGVINLRGIIIPIIDLRLRFNIEPEAYTDSTRFIIVKINDMEVGLIVDVANDVLDIPVHAIEPPPEVTGEIDAEYLRGVVKVGNRLLILLNLDKVLTSSDLKDVTKIEG